MKPCSFLRVRVRCDCGGLLPASTKNTPASLTISVAPGKHELRPETLKLRSELTGAACVCTGHRTGGQCHAQAGGPPGPVASLGTKP